MTWYHIPLDDNILVQNSWLAKLIATEICKLVNSKNKDGPKITLKWKDESEEKHNTVIMHTKPKISPDQNDLAQEDQIHKGPSTSRRQKKPPTTKDDNFLW
jgi:hypothetical protein